jgi:hypothetical protein
MDKDIDDKQRRRIPYWAVMLITVTTTCVLANLFTMAAQRGYFRLWKSLPLLPANAVSILDADGNNVWVETEDGNLYTLKLSCGNTDTNCNQWSRVNDPSGITPFQCTPLQRGASCNSLEGPFSLGNPLIGEVQECVVANGCFPDPSYVTETRFALMSDRTVKYWHHGNGFMGPYIDLALSTIAFPFIAVIIVSVIYSKGRRKTG